MVLLGYNSNTKYEDSMTIRPSHLFPAWTP